MQDNAPPHRAILTKDFLADADIPIVSWPAVSSDLNPIENVWADLRDALKQHPLPYQPTSTNAILNGIDAYPYVCLFNEKTNALNYCCKWWPHLISN